MNRRDYLKFQLLSLSTLTLPRALFAELNPTPSSFISPAKRGNSKWGLAIGQTESTSVDFFETGFDAHAIIQSPTYPHLAVIFQRRGAHAALIDLKKLKVITELSPPSEMNFYGHGDFFEDGARIIFTTIPRDLASYGDRGAMLGIYNIGTRKMESTFQIPCGHAHDIRRSQKDGEFLFCYNPMNKKTSGIGIVRAEDKTVIREAACKSNHSPGHFVVDKKNRVITIANYSEGDSPAGQGALYVLESDWKLNQPVDLELHATRSRNEVLSIAIDDEGRWSCITAPGSNDVFLYDLKMNVVAKRIPSKKPFGVFYLSYRGVFIVTNEHSLSELNPRTAVLSPLKTPPQYEFCGHSSLLRPFV